MMGSFSEEEDRYFDTREDITSVSDSGSDCADNSEYDLGVYNSLPGNLGYEVWIKSPTNISERRNNFLNWMRVGVGEAPREDSGNMSYDETRVETNRMTEQSGAVLGSLPSDDDFSSGQSSMSCVSSDARELMDGVPGEKFACRIKNLDDGTEFIIDELGQDGMFDRLRIAGSNRLLTISEFERNLGFSCIVQQAMRRDLKQACDYEAPRKEFKKGWLRRLGAVTCTVGQGEPDNLKYSYPYPIVRPRTQTVRVRSCRKRSKELSALYVGQDIKAHEGSILSMKFSPDGQYLASAGEDCIVRVWQIMVSERIEEFDIHDLDPSCAYFTLTNNSEIMSLDMDKEIKGKLKSMRKASDSTCVIFPQKVFKIAEKPIHEFHGHSGEVLDLSWSKNKYILSSSVDKTVRLWQVGWDQCIKVFSHNDYVTCVQFNPMDDDYFISGSIDGKVRIWGIPRCQVVDWTDIHDIVTAVCYRPDGKGGIIGSMTGNCHFYDASDNRLQLYAQICLKGKKKSSSKRITGFQFCPSDPSKLMVTSADSQVRILHGVDVLCKFRGLYNTGSQIFASFTSDGMHAVSASEDSNVYVWNCDGLNGPVKQAKNIWSCERFSSNSASVAIPWRGTISESSALVNLKAACLSPKLPVNIWKSSREGESQLSELGESSQSKLTFSSPDNLSSLNHGLFSDPFSKVSATWPEEKLPIPSPLLISPAMCKSQGKLLKTSCQGILASPHMWGLVIVTGGLDGFIRSFQNYGLPVHT